MQRRSKKRSPKSEKKAQDENPKAEALLSPRPDNNRELSEVKPERPLPEVKQKAGEWDDSHEQFRSRLLRGQEKHGDSLYSRFILQVAEANADFLGREAQTFDHVSDALERLSPRDTLEAMLSVQITAVHVQAMTYMRLAVSRDQTSAGADFYINLATRLMRTFAALTEALARHRSKGGQKMTVEHVHVHQGGQAIVGQVNQKTLTSTKRGKSGNDQASEGTPTS